MRGQFAAEFTANKETRDNIIKNSPKSNEILRKMVEGDDFKKWHLSHSGRYMIASGYDIDIPNDYPAIFDYLKSFKEKLIKRADQGKNYWNLRSCDYYEKFDKPKLIYYHTAVKHNFYFDTEGYYISANCYFIGNADRYLQCLLNSRLFDYVKKFLFPAFGDSENGGRVRLDANKMSELPVLTPNQNTKETFTNLAERISLLSKEFEGMKLKFIEYLNSSFSLIKLSSKLCSWTDLTFPDFIKELNKAIKANKGVPLTKKDEFEWMELFEENKQKVVDLKTHIDQTDREIDRMVYALYGLTEEEIAIVEGS
jgi:hypothetical protein